jgi:hypothetical protein
MIIDDTATALYTTLKAGTALTAMLSGTTSIYHMQAPDDAGLPYMVFNHQGGGPDLINPSNLESNIWWIRSYSVTSALNSALIFEQADLLLHKKNITITDATTIQCVREQNITLVEQLPTGKPIYTCGGMYRIRTTNT